jgi:hypothetical protein
VEKAGGSQGVQAGHVRDVSLYRDSVGNTGSVERFEDAIGFLKRYKSRRTFCKLRRKPREKGCSRDK